MSQSRGARPPISVGAGAVVIHDQRVLLVRNIRGVTRGRYLLPAGNIHAGETPDRTAARETFEETNLHVEVEGLLGVRLWVLESGDQNYFFMFRAKLLSPVSDLQPNLDEVDDARFFSREEMQALGPDETWSGAVAIALKGFDEQATLWPNYADLSDTSGINVSESWRIWF